MIFLLQEVPFLPRRVASKSRVRYDILVHSRAASESHSLLSEEQPRSPFQPRSEPSQGTSAILKSKHHTTTTTEAVYRSPLEASHWQVRPHESKISCAQCHTICLLLRREIGMFHARDTEAWEKAA